MSMERGRPGDGGQLVGFGHDIVIIADLVSLHDIRVVDFRSRVAPRQPLPALTVDDLRYAGFLGAGVQHRSNIRDDAGQAPIRAMRHTAPSTSLARRSPLTYRSRARTCPARWPYSNCGGHPRRDVCSIAAWAELQDCLSAGHGTDKSTIDAAPSDSPDVESQVMDWPVARMRHGAEDGPSPTQTVQYPKSRIKS
jgi:hypothetical protein